jgi:hypothetical protein
VSMVCNFLCRVLIVVMTIGGLMRVYGPCEWIDLFSVRMIV